ncbi:MAG: bifunctional 3-(3-hydroxy-phenyl)propionate/3-hydroxycinnamic acid hydroxylase [Burkholderiaceae bacterium]
MNPRPETMDVDVLIAGYGPTGATLAALLGRRGWRVAVIERAPAIYDKPRAITADHEALRVFQQIGIAEQVLASAVPHPGTDFVGLQGQVIKRFYPAPPPHALGWIPNFMFVQPELEATLRDAIARDRLARVLLEHELVGYEQSPDRVRARLRRVDPGHEGEEIVAHARYLVGADGASSAVRRQMAPAIEDLAFDEWWLIVDAWIQGPVQLPERMRHYCRPSRPGTYIVGPGRLRRWEIKILPHERPEMFHDHEAVWRVLGEFVDTSALVHCRTAVYRFHALVIERWQDGRVFLAGDAAHQMPPFMGQGLCAGVRDAFNLAWKLDGVLTRRLPESLLQTYGPERKQHVRTVVAHTKAFGLIIGELDPDAARERDRRLAEELRSGRAETIRQRFIPGLETGLIARGTDGRPAPGAGDLLVQPWVRETDGPWRRLDDVLGAGFAIVARRADDLAALEEDTIGFCRSIGARIVLVGAQCQTVSLPGAGVLCLEAREPLLDHWFDALGASALIARPDRYVYGAADGPTGLRALLLGLMARLGDDPRNPGNC